MLCKMKNQAHYRIDPIDRPFRFSWDFCVVWALLATPTFLLTRHMGFGPWYSYVGLLILLSLFSAFVLYGPVLLARQVFRSGSRGRLVARALLAILLVAVLLFGGLYFSGLYTESRARVMASFFIIAATLFLSWRTERK